MAKTHQELVGLSETSKSILLLLSAGRDMEQIVAERAEFTRELIAEAAAEALLLDDLRGYVALWRDTKERSPRTMTRWTANDDAELVALHAGRIAVPRVAEMLGRPVSAIHRRILMLGLSTDLLLDSTQPLQIDGALLVGESSEPKSLAQGSGG